MAQLLTGETFGRGSTETGRRQIIYNMAAGTALIEVRDERDQVDADYVVVPDTSLAVTTTFTFNAEPGFIYRVTLTGDATCMVSGKPRR